MHGKLAKWYLMTVILAYYHLHSEVFMKPTTVKGVIEYFELEGLKVNPTPSYEFYIRYRQEILNMKKAVDPLLSPNNPCFSGFLMMSLDAYKR